MKAFASIALCVLAACGGLSNQPLREGAVEGIVLGADPAVALVTVMGHSELRSQVSGDGSFALHRVPAGTVELFVISDRGHAARVQLSVAGAQTAQVTVQPEPGAFVKFHLETPGMQSGARALLSLEGTPFVGLPFQADGEQRIGPLPSGCYDAFVRAPGLGDRTVTVCVSAGEERTELLDFGGSDASCAESGCTGLLHCASDGRCVECTASADCGAGFSCVANDCVANQPVDACAPCTDDSQCAGGTCEGESGELRLCRQACNDATPCTQSGFVCNGFYCEPNPSLFLTCSGYRQVGTQCSEDSQCTSEGIVNGRCVEGACTLQCANDTDCPEHTRCLQGASGTFCAQP